MPIWVIFLNKKGLNLTSIGVLDAVAFAAIALLEIPSGALADLIGRKYTLAIGSFLYSLGMLFLALTNSISIVVIGYLLWHISNAFFSGTNYAYLYDTLKASNKESDYQKIAGRLRAISSIALASGSLIGGWIAATTSLSVIFYIIFALCLISTIIALTLKEPRMQKDTEIKQSVGLLIRSSLSFVISRPMVRNLILMNGIISTVPFIILYVMIQPYVQDKNIPIGLLGIIFVGIQLMGSLGSLVSNKIKGLLTFEKQIIFIPLLMIMILALLSFVSSSVGIALFALLSFVLSIFSLNLNTKLNNMINSQERATIMSLGSMISSILVVVYEPFMLYFYERISMAFSMLFSSGILLITAVPVALLIIKKTSSIIPVSDEEMTIKKANEVQT